MPVAPTAATQARRHDAVVIVFRGPVAPTAATAARRHDVYRGDQSPVHIARFFLAAAVVGQGTAGRVLDIVGGDGAQQVDMPHGLVTRNHRLTRRQRRDDRIAGAPALAIPSAADNAAAGVAG